MVPEVPTKLTVLSTRVRLGAKDSPPALSPCAAPGPATGLVAAMSLPGAGGVRRAPGRLSFTIGRP